MKKTLAVVKLGGSVLDNLRQVLSRIKQIKESCHVGPIVVVSAPRIHNGKPRSLTDVAIEIGESYAEHRPLPSDLLFRPYIDIASAFLNDSFREPFQKVFSYCCERVNQALGQILENMRFVDVNRARVLAYSGEFLAAALMDYVLRSNGIDSVHFDLENWPIITDENLESANFLRHESSQRASYVEDLLESGKIPVVGGYIGVTKQGLESTFERGGSDRTAADLSILLSDTYRPTLNLEKKEVVLSADPSLVKEDLESVLNLSYNEANLAGTFGMKIIDPSAIRDIQEAELNIPIIVSDIHDPSKVTLISRDVEYKVGNPVKIVTGRRDCTILDITKPSRDSLEDYLRNVRRFEEFLELRPYRRGKAERARFLILDACFLRRYQNELLSFDRNSKLVSNLAVITLIGDDMGHQAGVAAKAFDAVFSSGINIEDGDIQQPTSSILILVKNSHLPDAVKAIHARTRLSQKTGM